jgi:hypothetical protein
MVREIRVRRQPPAAVVAATPVAAPSLTTGVRYQIATLGTTNFTLLGQRPTLLDCTLQRTPRPDTGDGTAYAVSASTGVYATASQNSTNTSNFTGTNTYWYAVSAVNDAGESAATVFPVGVSVAANQEVNLAWANPSGVQAYRIYRVQQTSQPSATHPGWRFVGYTPKVLSGNSTFTDRNGTTELYNNFMPNTNISPLICRNPADLCIAQMSPLLKMPLAPISTTFEYLLLLYHTLVLKAPERQIIFKNVVLLRNNLLLNL